MELLFFNYCHIIFYLNLLELIFFEVLFQKIFPTCGVPNVMAIVDVTYQSQCIQTCLRQRDRKAVEIMTRLREVTTVVVVEGAETEARLLH